MDRQKAINEAVEAAAAGFSQVDSVKGFLHLFTGEEVEIFFKSAVQKAVKLGAIKNPNFEKHRFRMNKNVIIEEGSEYPELMRLVLHLFSQLNKRPYKRDDLNSRARSLWKIIYKPDFLAGMKHPEQIGTFAYILDGSPQTVRRLFNSEIGGIKK